MAVTTCVQPPRRLGIVSFSGAVDADEILQGIRGLFGHPAWEPGFDVLWDASAIRSLLLDPDAVERVVHHGVAPKRLPTTGRVALVTAREVDFMAARLLVERTRRGRTRELRFFDTVAEAAAWLGLSSDTLARARAGCREPARSEPVERRNGIAEAG